MNKAQFCRRLRVGLTTGWKLIKNGDIKAIRNGQRWEITEESYLQFLKDREEK